MKTAKRILTVALALMLIFALAAPSFALQTTGYVPVLNGAPYYIQGADSLYEMDGTFTVYLSMYTGIYDGVGPVDTVVPVTMGSTGATDVKYTVAQVLAAAQSQYSGVVFDTSTPDPTHYHSSYLYGVEITASNVTVSYNALPLKYNNNYYYCGWMFRINGMIPFYTHTVDGESVTEGCLISDAYVTANDVIDLYYDNMYTQSLATKAYTVKYVGKTLGTPTFQVLGTESYVNSSGENWTVTNWAKVTNSTMTVKIDGVSYSVTTDSNGKFTKTGLSSGTHTIQIQSASYSTAFSYTDGDNVSHSYKVPAYVGMYSRFSI